MEFNTATGRPLQRTGTSRRSFLRKVGLAGLGLGLGLKRACAGPTTSLEVLRARLAAARVCHPVLVGLEIGTSKVCVAVGQRTGQGLMKIFGVGEAASTGTLWGEIVNADAARHCVLAALTAAEQSSDVMIRSVHLAALGGPSDYGYGRRATNNIDCLERLNLEVCDVALPPIPCEWALLDAENKQRGALMIDLGAGKTGHVLYEAGQVKDYGCHRAGGAHVTNDLSMGLRMPWESAETLKIESGSAMAGSSLVDAEDPRALHERGGRYSDAEMMHIIIYLRLRAILEKVKARLIEKGARFDQLGAGIHLTGGGSLQRGVVELTSEVFGVPAFRATAKGFDGDVRVVQNPQYSCAIGLLKLSEWKSENDACLNTGRRYFGVVPV